MKKQLNIPCISYLLQVCALVIESCGTEDEAIALLRDAVEDVNVPIDFIAEMWGSNVARIVSQLSETDKDRYVENISAADDSTKLVSAADKLHNLTCYVNNGQHLWKPATENFYNQLIPIYEESPCVPDQ